MKRPFLLQPNAAIFLLLLCSCAAGPKRLVEDSSLPRPAETPFDYAAERFGLMLVPIQIDPKADLWFVFETGAPITVLDQSLEPKLGKPRKTTKIRSIYGITRTHLYAAPNLYLHGTRLRTWDRVATMDLTRLSEEVNRVTNSKHRISGLLGMDCLQNYCVQLDFAVGKLRFLDPDRAQGSEFGKAFRFRTSYDCRVRDNLLGLRRESTLIDTGCNLDGALTTTLFRQWTNSHSSAQQRLASFPNGVFGGATYTNLSLTADRKLNLIGLGFLARHLVTLNFPKRTMYLKEQGSAPKAAGD